MRTPTCLLAALILPLSACGDPSASPPAAPTGLTVTATTLEAVTLAWTDASADEADFVIERSVGEAPWAELARPAANATGHVDDTVVPDQDYAYRVRSAGPGGLSAPSDTVTTGTWRLATVAERLAVAIEAARGDEAPATSVTGSGMTIWFLGTALCSPPGPLAPPAGSPAPPATLYGCDNQANVTLARSGDVVTMNLAAAGFYADLTTTIPLAGTDAGALLATRMEYACNLPVAPMADGRLRLVGPVHWNSIALHFPTFQSADPAVSGLQNLVLDTCLTPFMSWYRDQLNDRVAAALPGLPAWVP